MHSPYRGRSHTKKQDQNYKQPISPAEKKIREQKKRLAKIFENLRFHLAGKFTGTEIPRHQNLTVKKGAYKSIYQHALKQNRSGVGFSYPGGGFLQSIQRRGSTR